MQFISTLAFWASQIRVESERKYRPAARGGLARSCLPDNRYWALAKYAYDAWSAGKNLMLSKEATSKEWYLMETIIVDKDLCTRCGICSAVCPMAIIDPGEESILPKVRNEKAVMCLQCGHCEVFCPSQALLLNLRPDERLPLPEGAGTVSAGTIAFYLKKRRSVRHFTSDPVPKDKILEILDIARYAASGSNGQPVQWLVVHDPLKVKKIAGLTIEWMKTLLNTAHPMSGYVPMFIATWEQGNDVICRGAPHLLFAHIPEGNPIASIDAIIALTHFDVAAPAFGIGTCWAGFVAMAAVSYEPLQKELGLPAGRKCAYAMMFGHPQYRVLGVPRRKPLEVMWQ